MATRRRHEDRVADVLTRWIAPGVRVDAETAVPSRHFRADFLLRVGSAADTWGVLRDTVSHREVIVEAWADAMPLRGLLTSRIKLLGRCCAAWPPRRKALPWAPEAHQAGPDRAPMALLVARRAPQVLAAEPGFEPWGAASGIHRHLLGAFGCLILVETARLDEASGTALLRMLTLPRSQAESEVMLDRVLRDTTLPAALRRRILEDIMNEQVTTTGDEHLSAYERAVRTGEKRGERRGERRGEKRGARQTLLQVASKVAPDALPRLEAIDDLAVLEAEVLRLLER